MDFKEHSHLEGKHAFLSPSTYHWVNYDEERLLQRFGTYKAAQLGTRLHAFAEEAIKLGIKLPRSKKTLNMFVNDAIGFKMQTEQLLYYSEYSFGTTDAISFRNNLLRIHDYKSGVTPASMTQLKVYAALFCLEYGKSPSDIKMELRIYQNDEIIGHTPEPDDILYIMNQIITFDEILERSELEV